MRFTFETHYNQKSLSVMAGCIRKTVRRSRSKRSHIAGWIVAVLGLLLSFSSGEEGFAITFNAIITWLAVLAILLALLFEDRINGYFARKRMLRGTEKAIATFDTENADMFLSETEIGKTEFSYDKILVVAETNDYFVFLFSANHAQIYDKSSLMGGTISEFREFLQEKSKKPIIPVKA